MSHCQSPAPMLQPHRFAVLRRSFRLPPSAFARRRGLSLVEMLVALAVTLVMMAAVVNLFANLSGSIRNRRAMIEAGAQLRQVRTRMQLDLAGATCQGRTWVQPAENQGYIEYIEGRRTDMDPSRLLDGVIDTTSSPKNLELDYATSLVPSGGDPTMDFTVTTPPLSTRKPEPGDVTNGRALGDWDDILALTVRSESEPFTAQVDGATVASPLAEVIWYAGENDQDDPTTPQDETLVGGSRTEPGMRRVYRRVYLIAPWLGPWTGNRPPNVSVRFEPGNNRWVANTLADLSKREYRSGREPGSPFPHPLADTNSDSEYLVLSDALAFDVRLFDAGAPLFQTAGGATLQPGDIAWAPTAAAAITAGTPPTGFGAYVDLGWARPRGGTNLLWPLGGPQPATVEAPLRGMTELRTMFNTLRIPSPIFHVPHEPGWHPRNRMVAVGFPAVYDTWSFHYENDGINHDQFVGDVVTDQGANGMDDPVMYDSPLEQDSLAGSGGTSQLYGVDDIGERETAPPYDVPLSGLQVRFRIYEMDARQIREASVTQSFGQ